MIYKVMLFLFISILSFGQNTYKLSGKVVDSNNEGIPYVNITIKNKYRYFSDEKGNFVIKTISDKDSITFRALGFKTQTVSYIILKNNLKIILERDFFELKELKVYSKKSIWLGYNNQKETIKTYNNLDSEVSESGILIDNKNKISGIIKKVKVKVGFIGRPKLPFRINLYSIGIDGLPTENLLKSSIIFTAKKKLKWFEFDLEFQQIEMPENGVCLALEFINPSTKNYKLNSEFSPLRLGFFTTEYKSVSRQNDSNGWYFSNTSVPAFSLQVIIK